MPRDFRSYALPIAGNPFEELSASARFEDAGKGRAGAVLSAVDTTGLVPLVRTTTRYRTPAQRFGAVHARLAEQIREQAALPGAFNNALIERYTNAYATMGSHCDQALDLAEESFIAVFSCYRRPFAADPPRRLIVEPKEPGGEAFAVPLTHNGAVVFSVAANRRHRHKIVLDASARAVENEWLGVTFRTSKTLVRFRDGDPHLPDGHRLTLADEDQQREFYRLRRRENAEPDFDYPGLTYTISESDLMPA
nr:hypothetical protein GCM10020063_042370 [Dactylosporangium thailandense]